MERFHYTFILIQGFLDPCCIWDTMEVIKIMVDPGNKFSEAQQALSSLEKASATELAAMRVPPQRVQILSLIHI